MIGFLGTVVGWLQYHVGVRTDAANASGSLHAKVSDAKNKIAQKVSPSENQKFASDTERYTVSTSYTKMKEIIMYVNGSINVSHELKISTETIPSAHTQVYVNGVAVGAEHSSTSNYHEVTDTIYIKSGDAVQLYAKSPASDKAAYVRNFRIKYDIQAAEGYISKD